MPTPPNKEPTPKKPVSKITRELSKRMREQVDINRQDSPPLERKTIHKIENSD